VLVRDERKCSQAVEGDTMCDERKRLQRHRQRHPEEWAAEQETKRANRETDRKAKADEKRKAQETKRARRDDERKAKAAEEQKAQETKRAKRDDERKAKDSKRFRLTRAENLESRNKPKVGLAHYTDILTNNLERNLIKFAI
jgi:hypothetical protein